MGLGHSVYIAPWLRDANCGSPFRISVANFLLARLLFVLVFVPRGCTTENRKEFSKSQFATQLTIHKRLWSFFFKTSHPPSTYSRAMFLLRVAMRSWWAAPLRKFSNSLAVAELTERKDYRADFWEYIAVNMLTGFVPPSRGNALVMGRTVAHPVGMSAGICMCCRVLRCLATWCSVLQFCTPWAWVQVKFLRKILAAKYRIYYTINVNFCTICVNVYSLYGVWLHHCTPRGHECW